MEKCNLCPNKCNIDRNLSFGSCNSDNTMRIGKYYLHPFEEPILSKNGKSGTIFFTGCALKCVFCQNYEISHTKSGKPITTSNLVDIFKELEDLGAENIDLVTPSHFVKQIAESLDKYKPKVPVVYNSHGYELTSSLKIIDDYIDIYLPDLKFFSPSISKRYAKVENYFEIASECISFMMDSKKAVISDGVMQQGTIVRHLILPLCTNDSIEIVKWFNSNQKNGAYLSLMAQYTKMKDFSTLPELNRGITKKEYDRVLDTVFSLGIENCIIQERTSSSKKFVPIWDLK